MAGNLLDALKHAGLADAKKAKKIENEKKQQQHRDLKRESAPHEPARQTAAAAAGHDFIAVGEQNGAAGNAIAKDAAVQNAQNQAAERLRRIYAQAPLRNAAGRKKFYFETPDHFIECIGLSDVAYALLDRGKYAIAQNEACDDYIVVSRATALNLEAVDKRRVVVFRRQET